MSHLLCPGTCLLHGWKHKVYPHMEYIIRGFVCDGYCLSTVNGSLRKGAWTMAEKAAFGISTERAVSLTMDVVVNIE